MPETFQVAARSLAFSGWRQKNDEPSSAKAMPPKHSDLLKEGLARSAMLIAEPLAATWQEDGACTLALPDDRRELTPQIHCSNAAGEDALRAIQVELLRGLAQWMRASDLTQVEFVVADGRASFHARDNSP